MLERRALRSVRRAQKRKQELTGRIFFVTAVVLTIFASAIFILRNNFLLLHSISFEGNTVTTDEELEKAVYTSLQGSYFKIIPKRNVLLYPEKKVKPYLLSVFPRLQTVSVRLSGAGSLIVLVAEYSPSAMWCGETETKAVPCYFIDKEGRIFAVAPDFTSSQVYVKYYGPVGNNPLGKIFTLGSFARIDSFVQSLRQINLAPVAVSIDEKGDGTITLKTGNSILFNPSDDLAVAFENLTLFLKENEKEFSQNPFTYIDLRFGNKIFYKP